MMKTFKALLIANMCGLCSVIGLALLPAIAIAASPCGAVACKPSTEHRLSVLAITDGMGHTISVPYVGADQLPGAATQACEGYAAAHSDASVTTTISQCTMQLPIADPGGPWGSIPIKGHYVVTDNQTGGIVSQGDSTWNMLTPSCSDSINSENVAVGSYAQCFCKAPMDWDDNLQACVTVIDKRSNSNSCRANTAVGNPIVPLLGAKLLRQDLGITIRDQKIELLYDTRDRVPLAAVPTSINAGSGGLPLAPLSLENQWSTTVHKGLYIQRNGTGTVGFTVHAFRGNGQFLSFTHPSSLVYTPVNPSVREKMSPVLDGGGNPTSKIQIIDAEGNVEVYDTYSLSTAYYADLHTVSYANGGGLWYSYSTSLTPSGTAPESGLIIGITDEQGRVVKFRYEKPSIYYKTRLRQIEAQDGRMVNFLYNGSNRFAQIQWPDGKIREYLYERSDLPWAVTGIVDENNSRLSTYTYDSGGRSIGTELA
ncbi:MAG: hypothetical protein ABIR26_05350, partial [Ramlibacter sp.]